VENKIIVYGFGTLSQQITQVLRQKKYELLVIEEDEELLKKAKSKGFEVQKMSLMDDDNLKSLGIEKDIKAFFCLSADKNENLFVTLSARNLNKELKIITVSFSKDDNKAILLAGADKVINPYEIGALRIFRQLHKPLILDMLDNILFSESNIEVTEITIQKGSIFDGVYLKDISLAKKYNLIIIGIQDKEIDDRFIFFSSGINHKIDHGDTLVVLGYSHDLKTFRKIAQDI
jgi:voltage-gated potassium channel